MALETDPDTSMTNAIIAAINSAAERLRETAILAAVETYERELRKEIANCAMKLTSYYDVERLGKRLIITVRIGK